MTTELTHRGRGGRRALTAPVVLAALSVLLGLALLILAVRGQTPDPPAPATSAMAPASSAAPDGPTTGSSAAATAAPSGRSSAGPAGSGVQDDPGRVPGPSSDPSTAAPSTGAPPAKTPESEAEEGFDPVPASVPTRLQIPAIEVTSPLHPLGLAADGTLQVPSGDRYDEAAWYSGSPTPGETGPTVLEGHVTGPGGRPSIFFELGALQPGDLVQVDREDGSTVTFEVYRAEQYAKDDFPTVAVYGPTSGAELRLITCGGEFDDQAGHHLDNTVVFARAVAVDRG